VIIKITSISTAKKGNMVLARDSTLTPDMLEATNRTSPIGGVTSPTVKLTDIMMAK